MMSASQAIFRAVEAVTGPVKSRFRCVPWLRSAGLPAVCCGAPAGRVVSEPGEQVAVVDGDHDLRAESSGGGQGAGGEGDFAGADEAVEEFLRARAQVQGGPARPAAAWPTPGRRLRCRPRRPLRRRRPGAGVLLACGRCGGWWRCS